MSFLSKTSDSHYKLNTIVVFLLSIFFVWFFFYCKHDFRLSKVNVFNVDPYDGVGSIGTQVSFLAAMLSIMRLVLSCVTKVLPDSQIILILRGNIVALFSIGVTMITHTIALIRFIESWINYSSGIVLAALYFSFCC
jgi:hypothetical protein